MGWGHTRLLFEESDEKILGTVSGLGGDCSDLDQGIGQEPFDLIESDRLDFFKDRVSSRGTEHVFGRASRAFHP